MNGHDLSLVLSGALLFGFVLIALFFLRFWRQTRERLFLCFALAFFLLGAERVMLMVAASDFIHRPLFYVTRLVAFLAIAWAIWDKNRPGRE